VAGTTPSSSNLVGYLTASNVSVNPTYGVWNGAMANIE
jgi:hypothetical protein